jgi:low affinity Fe/Cu permease
VESPALIGNASNTSRPFWLFLNERFRAFAHRAAMASGSPWAFTLGVLGVAVWALSGHWFDYSETWQLVINTSTTIVTFLMVFVVQNTQARDSRELHVKLDELLRALESARSDIIRCSELSDDQLDALHARLQEAAGKKRSDGSAQDLIVIEAHPEGAQ